MKEWGNEQMVIFNKKKLSKLYRKSIAYTCTLCYYNIIKKKEIENKKTNNDKENGGNEQC